ncbi:copper amine oxidase N-terminal domain-containing protein [Paenibacillus glacialis]|uniref:Copper amine oxidase-like N-terminal domain-containing protein n=1 Tax=Paenibacillus glacialis TaxID=494026 RepID=A0A168HQU1_9BACL|nr:copper amine oxidase N-terminal domain-containing protein [Paenibacillus glacialis]OAB38434.1 hypothetical protein PGLA_20290 [Paenibacillus glacialis]
MKKMIITLMVIVTGVSSAMIPNQVAASQSSIAVLLNGKTIRFSDERPFQDSQGSVMVPIRSISNALGAEIIWAKKNGNTTLDIRDGNNTVSMTVGQTAAVVNGKTKDYGTKIIVMNNRTFVPLRVVGEGFGQEVKWSAVDRIAYITSPGSKVTAPNNELGEKDRFGREIRTKNLPKNYSDYPYILTDIPNEMYEMKAPKRAYLPSDLINYAYIKDDKAMEYWKRNTEAYYDLLLNVNYKTIDDQWAKDLFSHINQSNVFNLTEMKKYVSWVKKNKILIEGSLEAEPSIIFYDELSGKFYIRTSFKFRIVGYDKYKSVIYDIFFDGYEKLQKGVWYEGYADIPLSTNIFNNELLSVSASTSLFEKSIIYKSKN